MFPGPLQKKGGKHKSEHPKTTPILVVSARFAFSVVQLDSVKLTASLHLKRDGSETTLLLATPIFRGYWDVHGTW